MTNIILNKTTKSSDRYRLMTGSAGCYGCPKGHPNHRYVVVGGVDRGNGYQSYTAVSYFLGPEMSWVPQDARDRLLSILTEEEKALLA